MSAFGLLLKYSAFSGFSCLSHCIQISNLKYAVYDLVPAHSNSILMNGCLSMHRKRHALALHLISELILWWCSCWATNPQDERQRRPCFYCRIFRYRHSISLTPVIMFVWIAIEGSAAAVPPRKPIYLYVGFDPRVGRFGYWNNSRFWPRWKTRSKLIRATWKVSWFYQYVCVFCRWFMIDTKGISGMPSVLSIGGDESALFCENWHVLVCVMIEDLEGEISLSYFKLF